MFRLCDYLTVVEASEVLGVSKHTLQRWDRAEKLEARPHPVTGYRLYFKSELDEFLRDVNDGTSPAKQTRKGKPKARAPG